MNLLTIIYIIGALALGFLIGATFEIFADSEQIRKLNHRIQRLELENQGLREGKTEVIEIIDNRTTPEEVDYFKPF